MISPLGPRRPVRGAALPTTGLYTGVASEGLSPQSLQAAVGKNEVARPARPLRRYVRPIRATFSLAYLRRVEITSSLPPSSVGHVLGARFSRRPGQAHAVALSRQTRSAVARGVAVSVILSRRRRRRTTTLTLPTTILRCADHEGRPSVALKASGPQ